MSKRLHMALLAATAVVCAGSVQAAGGNPAIAQAKQLAGPPEEFARMRAPDPADAAIVSRSALLPLAFDGAPVLGQALPVPASGRLRFVLMSGGDDWAVDLLSPAGDAIAAADLQRRARATRLGGIADGQPGTMYRLDGLRPGNWTLRLRTNTPGARGYVLVEGDAATALVSHQVHRRQLVGERIDFVAQLAADEGSEVRLGTAAGTVESAQLRLLAPDGRERRVPMFDDGRHADGAAGDGRYGASFVATAEGDHIAQVLVHGRDAGGAALVRTAEHLVPVLASSLRLGSEARATPATVGRWSVALPARDAGTGRHYRVHAEVWGHAGGKPAPIAWIGGMVEPRAGMLDLGLDARWIALAGAGAPYELRNVRVEDPDHFIPLATAARLPMVAPEAPVRRTRRIEIDEAMTMGPRPAALSAMATGSRLLLVHGYCSAGVWPQGQFASASTFLDVNQNRSHDQFAQRIRTFGAQWNSFGTVAHSQGGAAALHLYTYYWSGLDNATGNRLMQSVGTPYQGTNLAGILATVGNWFGVACGSNSNMTYDGAAAWLALIPASARAKVDYYSTSFRHTNWYTNDYCHMASDLVLDDPEDGTVEQTHAQLPGAVNRGHAVGQCHTAGMRDPAQYGNAARNATMSANAAR